MSAAENTEKLTKKYRTDKEHATCKWRNCFALRELHSCFLSHWKEYDRTDNFFLIMNQTEFSLVHNQYIFFSCDNFFVGYELKRTSVLNLIRVPFRFKLSVLLYQEMIMKFHEIRTEI